MSFKNPSTWSIFIGPSGIFNFVVIYKVTDQAKFTQTTHKLFGIYIWISILLSLEQIRVFVDWVYLVRNYISLDVES